jgi:hypothetical protein
MKLAAVRDVFAHAGPFVTVHAEVGRESEDALTDVEVTVLPTQQMAGPGVAALLRWDD